jgi:hypothetical protein
MPYEEWRATELMAALPGGEVHAARVHELKARVTAGIGPQAAQAA